jgi:hypothetical protein
MRGAERLGSLYPWSASCGKLFAMGNKDARRREIKKPKKKAPPKLTQPSTYVINKPTVVKP